MEIGIIGLPYSGKTTIFSTLLKHKTNTAGKQNSERGVVKVPDPRLDKLSAMFNPKKQVNATIDYVKVAGLESDSTKQGLPAQFLANLKNVDTLLIMVRDFENEFYPHPLERINPKADMDYIQSEFLISDLMIVETRQEKLSKLILKTQNEQDKRELALMDRLREQLDQEKPLRELEFSEQEALILRGYQFLSAKPVLYVINTAEDRLASADTIEKDYEAYVGENCTMTTVSAEIELELSDLSPEDAAVFMEDLGISEPALDKLIRKSYELMGLISFFTVGEDECRSWPIRRGTVAQKAAGVIHSDLEKGFIRAETVHYNELIEQGSLAACKEKGLLRLEGKEYPVKDGDILNIRFNV